MHVVCLYIILISVAIFVWQPLLSQSSDDVIAAKRRFASGFSGNFTERPLSASSPQLQVRSYIFPNILRSCIILYYTLRLRKNVTLFIFVTSLSDFIRFC